MKIHEAEQHALIDAALRATTTEDSARETTRLTASTSTGAGAPAAASAPATAIRKSS